MFWGDKSNMATLQASYFTKGGSAEWGNCQALLIDKLRLEAIVTFTATEISQGAWYWISWVVRQPNGSNLNAISQFVKASSIATFIQDRDIVLESGTYTITNTTVNKL